MRLLNYMKLEEWGIWKKDGQTEDIQREVCKGALFVSSNKLSSKAVYQPTTNTGTCTQRD